MCKFFLCKSKKIKKNIDVPSNLLNDFRGFKEVAIEIFNNHIKDYYRDCPIYNLTTEYAAPCVVNFAFAIELGLKYLLNYESNFDFGHNIKKLFNNLSNNMQNNIINVTAAKHDSWTIKNKNKVFRSELKRIKNNFVDWRYRFNFNVDIDNEDGSKTVITHDTSVYFLYALVKSINEIIDTLPPKQE